MKQACIYECPNSINDLDLPLEDGLKVCGATTLSMLLDMEARVSAMAIEIALGLNEKLRKVPLDIQSIPLIHTDVLFAVLKRQQLD